MYNLQGFSSRCHVGIFHLKQSYINFMHVPVIHTLCSLGLPEWGIGICWTIYFMMAVHLANKDPTEALKLLLVRIWLLSWTRTLCGLQGKGRQWPMQRFSFCYFKRRLLDSFSLSLSFLLSLLVLILCSVLSSKMWSARSLTQSNLWFLNLGINMELHKL